MILLYVELLNTEIFEKLGGVLFLSIDLLNVMVPYHHAIFQNGLSSRNIDGSNTSLTSSLFLRCRIMERSLSNGDGSMWGELDFRIRAIKTPTLRLYFTPIQKEMIIETSKLPTNCFFSRALVCWPIS